MRSRRVRKDSGSAGMTTHVIEPAVEARFVRLNVIRPSYNGDSTARMYEFEVYGPDGRKNLAIGRPATGSVPCSEDEGPEKAVNGSVSGGKTDKWCAEDRPLFLQVDLGETRPVKRFVVKHASAGGEDEELDTREFNIQVSMDGKVFTTVETSSGAGFVEERTEYRSSSISTVGGARLMFVDGKLESRNTRPAELRRGPDDLRGDLPVLLPAAGDLLRLSRHVHVSLPRGDDQPHAALLVPRAGAARSAAAGKYAAGLIASAAIFGGGALLAFAAMLWPHDSVQVQAYWNAGGLVHVFWYGTAAVLGCVGYGSVFLALGLYIRNPIVPAAVLLAWEGANGILPHVLQKISILYYLQSLCPVPAPMDADAPTLIRLLAAPAAPASRPGAILGLLLLTAFVLWIAGLAVRRMQISYGTES